jgi:hypothetical protein
VRIAILISLTAVSLAFTAAQADEPFIKADLGSRTGYIIPEAYAAAYKADLLASMPWHVSLEGFWTPTEADAAVAERTFRELLRQAAKDPITLFPDLGMNSDKFSLDALKTEQNELVLIGENEDAYARQFVGIILSDGRKLIFCNYAEVPKADPSTGFLFLEKFFVADGTVHFLQCQFDPESKTCSHVSIIGSWQPPAK